VVDLPENSKGGIGGKKNKKNSTNGTPAPDLLGLGTFQSRQGTVTTPKSETSTAREGMKERKSSKRNGLTHRAREKRTPQNEQPRRIKSKAAVGPKEKGRDKNIGEEVRKE